MGANDECNGASGFNNNQTGRDNAKAAVSTALGNAASNQFTCASLRTMLYCSITS